MRGVLERGQEGFDGGDGLIDQGLERDGSPVGCPAPGRGVQDGDERGRGELDLIIAGGSPGAIGQQAGDQAGASALLAGIAGVKGRGLSDEAQPGQVVILVGLAGRGDRGGGGTEGAGQCLAGGWLAMVASTMGS